MSAKHVSTQQRLRIADLDLTVTDPLQRTTQYIYDEIFEGRSYIHPRIKLPERAVIIDVGANVGLFAIWAAREYRPKTILAYEASPTTNECLVENVARNIDGAATATHCINLAVSRGDSRRDRTSPWSITSTVCRLEPPPGVRRHPARSSPTTRPASPRPTTPP